MCLIGASTVSGFVAWFGVAASERARAEGGLFPLPPSPSRVLACARVVGAFVGWERRVRRIILPDGRSPLPVCSLSVSASCLLVGAEARMPSFLAVAMVSTLTTLVSRRAALIAVPMAMKPNAAPAVATIPECLQATDTTTRRVLDTAGYLDVESYDRLDRILAKLESDTGFSIKVLTRSRRSTAFSDESEDSWTNAQASKILRCGFNASPTPSTILIVADRGIAGALEAGSSFLTFPYVGDTVLFSLPGVF